MRKSENINVPTLRYDSNVAFASILYNMGETAGLETIFDHFSCKLGNLAVRKLDQCLKANKRKKAAWRILKPKLLHRRHRNQLRFQSTSKSRLEYTYTPSQDQKMLVIEEEREQLRQYYESQQKPVPDNLVKKRKMKRQKGQSQLEKVNLVSILALKIFRRRSPSSANGKRSLNDYFVHAFFDKGR